MNDISCIRCVVFDLDDTLWPCLPPILNAEKVLYSWLQDNYPRVTTEYSIEGLREHRADFLLRNPRLSHDMTALRKQSLAELAKTFNYSIALANEGMSLFRYHRNQVSLFDDALPTINLLREKFKIGSITNGNADLRAIGLGGYFDFIVTAEEAGVAKPDNAIFRYAQNKVKLESHELLYVGDHPENDVIGSKSSGWQALWFNPDSKEWPKELSEEAQPIAQIQALSELPTLLKG